MDLFHQLKCSNFFMYVISEAVNQEIGFIRVFFSFCNKQSSLKYFCKTCKVEELSLFCYQLMTIRNPSIFLLLNEQNPIKRPPELPSNATIIHLHWPILLIEAMPEPHEKC